MQNILLEAAHKQTERQTNRHDRITAALAEVTLSWTLVYLYKHVNARL